MKHDKGQILIGVVVLIAVTMILVPVMVQMSQKESRWTAKEQKNTQAFHLAELALERGYQQLLLATGTWVTVSGGGAVAGYNFDATYTDVAGGQYQIRLSSAPNNSVYITAVGRDRDRREVRALQALYEGSGKLTSAIYGEGSVSVAASGNVEWAPIMSHNTITTTANHPRLYSTGDVTKDDNGPVVPNTDNTQWWSYYANMPDMPSIDLNYYKGVAQAAGATSANCGGNFYTVGNVSFQGCNGGGLGVTGTWYVTGNIVFKAGAGGNIINGTVIALGNVEVQGNGGATRTMTVPLPPKAWKEYGNDWAFYKATYDPGAPATFILAKESLYSASTNATINNILISGLLYVGGDFLATGSGNSAFYGVAIVQAQPSIGSNVTFYFQPNVTASLQLTTQVPTRIGWQNVGCSWGAGNAVCP